MNKFQKALKKIALLAKGRKDLAFKRKILREESLASQTNPHSQSHEDGISQNGQDDWVIEHFREMQEPGTFVEFGAHDGKLRSNTYRLETEFNWGGILVEPIPDAFESLANARSCKCTHACITGTPGDVQFLEVTGPACQLSGIAKSFPRSHLARIDQALQVHGGEKVSHTIRGITLDQLLTQHKVAHVNYLSIDTEGSEYEILKAFPFDKYRIDVIAVENTYHGDFLIELMDKNRYELVAIRGGDEIYVPIKSGK